MHDGYTEFSCLQRFIEQHCMFVFTMFIDSSTVVTVDHYISVLNCARCLLCLFDVDVIFKWFIIIQ